MRAAASIKKKLICMKAEREARGLQVQRAQELARSPFCYVFDAKIALDKHFAAIRPISCNFQ